MTLFLTKRGKPVSPLAEFTSVQTAFLYFYDSVLQSLFKQQREHLSCKCYCYCAQDVIAGWADSPPLLFSRWSCGTSTRWPASPPWCLWTRRRGRSCVETVYWWSGMTPKVRSSGLRVHLVGGTKVIFDLNPWTQAPVIKLWKCRCLLRG